MTRLRSICETRLGETPTYLASPRTVRPFCSRALRRRDPSPAEILSRRPSADGGGARVAFRGRGPMVVDYTERFLPPSPDHRVRRRVFIDTSQSVVSCFRGCAVR